MIVHIPQQENATTTLTSDHHLVFYDTPQLLISPRMFNGNGEDLLGVVDRGRHAPFEHSSRFLRKEDDFIITGGPSNEEDAAFDRQALQVDQVGICSHLHFVLGNSRYPNC